MGGIHVKSDVLYARGHHCMHGGVRMYEGNVSYPVDKEFNWVVIDGITYKKVDRPRGYVAPETAMERTAR